MRRTDLLIKKIRERTNNLNFSIDASTGDTLEGISDNLILEYLNDAQDHLQAVVLKAFPNEFIVEKEISIVANQEAYSISDRVFSNNKIVSVEYSHTGNAQDYDILDQGYIRDRDTSSGYPSFYIRRAGQILLQPIPRVSKGKIRVSYYRELDDLDIRRGTVSARTLSPTQLTALTLSTTGDDPFALADADYICVNTSLGAVNMYGIQITGYSSSTGVVTLAGSAHTFSTGETVAVGDFVTIGRYSTTHSKLTDNCERYLKVYAQKRIMTKDESNTSIEEDVELKSIEDDILSSFVDESRDTEDIPILDEELMV